MEAIEKTTRALDACNVNSMKVTSCSHKQMSNAFVITPQSQLQSHAENRNSLQASEVTNKFEKVANEGNFSCFIISQSNASFENLACENVGDLVYTYTNSFRQSNYIIDLDISERKLNGVSDIHNFDKIPLANEDNTFLKYRESDRSDDTIYLTECLPESKNDSNKIIENSFESKISKFTCNQERNIKVTTETFSVMKPLIKSFSLPHTLTPAPHTTTFLHKSPTPKCTPTIPLGTTPLYNRHSTRLSNLLGTLATLLLLLLSLQVKAEQQYHDEEGYQLDINSPYGQVS